LSSILTGGGAVSQGTTRSNLFRYAPPPVAEWAPEEIGFCRLSLVSPSASRTRMFRLRRCYFSVKRLP